MFSIGLSEENFPSRFNGNFVGFRFYRLLRSRWSLSMIPNFWVIQHMLYLSPRAGDDGWEKYSVFQYEHYCLMEIRSTFYNLNRAHTHRHSFAGKAIFEHPCKIDGEQRACCDLTSPVLESTPQVNSSPPSAPSAWLSLPRPSYSQCPDYISLARLRTFAAPWQTECIARLLRLVAQRCLPNWWNSLEFAAGLGMALRVVVEGAPAGWNDRVIGDETRKPCCISEEVRDKLCWSCFSLTLALDRSLAPYHSSLYNTIHIFYYYSHLHLLALCIFSEYPVANFHHISKADVAESSAESRDFQKYPTICARLSLGYPFSHVGATSPCWWFLSILPTTTNVLYNRVPNCKGGHSSWGRFSRPIQCRQVEPSQCPLANQYLLYKQAAWKNEVNEFYCCWGPRWGEKCRQAVGSGHAWLWEG